MRGANRWAVALGFFLLGVAAGVAGMQLRLPVLSVRPPSLAPARRLEATVYLPVAGNPQQPFTSQEWSGALELLVAEFGGATLGPPLEGYWRDSSGKLQREPVRPVIVSFEPARLDRFRRIVHEVGRRLGQETVYTRFEEPRVELLPVGPESLVVDR